MIEAIKTFPWKESWERARRKPFGVPEFRDHLSGLDLENLKRSISYYKFHTRVGEAMTALGMGVLWFNVGLIEIASKTTEVTALYNWPLTVTGGFFGGIGLAYFERFVGSFKEARKELNNRSVNL